MSTFEVKIYKLKIEEHPNADALELAVVGDYRSIVRKGQFRTGSYGAYIPEGAVLPEWLIQRLGLEGKLAGKDKNRVKAVKLRGILSQGLIYPVSPAPRGYGAFKFENENSTLFVDANMNLMADLGITKYEPPIPTSMSGEVENLFGYTLKYDIENLKKFPNVLHEGEEVVLTEKLHGTWCCFGYHPEVEHPIVTSKGLSGGGLAFKLNEANTNNLYVRGLNATKNLTGDDVVTRIVRVMNSEPQTFSFLPPKTPFYLLGELFGKGVQDLQYGLDDVQFRAFDVYIGQPGQGRYLNDSEKEKLLEWFHIQRVPVLYKGPYSKEVVARYTDGKDTITGSHMREGVIITPTVERVDIEISRVILKSVSEDYLLRKGGTEFN